MTTKKDPTEDGLNRRSYLLAAAGVAGTLAGVSSVLADESHPGDDFEAGDIGRSAFVLEQGDACLPLAVVTSDENLPVEEFYDYRSSDTDPTGWYSAYGPAKAFEQAGNSVLYLYDGPNGTSLVFMHGKRGGDSGGAVTLDFSGLPADGEWAVTDDQYNATTNYDRFERSGDDSTVDWTWATDPRNGGGSDGGAFRGVTDDAEVRIDPAFNEEARLYGEHYVGEVERWNVLVADADEPRWFSLDMETPVVVRSGECAGSGTPPTRTTTASPTTTPTTTTTPPRTTRTTTRTTPTTSRTTSTRTPATSTRPATTAPPSTIRSTTADEVGGPAARTTESDGQAGFGAVAALGGLLGLGFRALSRREE
ncbi:hypothetical protein [Haladaptatus salinisoli]|uniref:hypothetical protein n=1 Tax=Haladaptatus salinisoli TaxID=2884876 RepID=UPI001D0B0CCA|nr:hypothetical protein [Haladaptatus salinisoli]